MLSSRLIELGVDARSCEIADHEVTAVGRVLDMAREGDLIMIFGDDIRRTWKQIISFNSELTESDSSDDNRSTPSFVEEDPQAFTLPEGEELIRDERGVRIARSEEEGD